ncbi:MAG TPA: hypothetical protein PK263_05405 [bacterium]|nr:hypothetical protein [bacterium]
MTKAKATAAALVLAFGLYAQAAQAATTLEIESNLSTGQKVFSVFATKSLSKQVGVFTYLYASASWSEGYAGLTYAPVSWLEAGLGYGVEQATPSYRIGGWIWAGKDRFSACYLFEDGGSGPWHKLRLDYQLTSRVKVGVVDRSFLGNGASVELKLNQGTKVQLTVHEHARLMTFSQAF